MWRLAFDMFNRKLIIKHNYTFLSSVLFRKQRTWLPNKQKKILRAFSCHATTICCLFPVMLPLMRWTVQHRELCQIYCNRKNVQLAFKFEGWCSQSNMDFDRIFLFLFCFLKERHHSKQTVYSCIKWRAPLFCWGKQRTSYPIRQKHLPFTLLVELK